MEKDLTLPPMQGIYLLLGTNLGAREKNLAQAKHLMQDKGIGVLRESAVYETAAWGVEDQPGFLNQVVEVKTELDPFQLLDKLLAIELEMGRVRERKWGERLIDLDILYYQNQLVDDERLSIPHPGISDRRFTLVPLVELAVDAVHPSLGKTQSELLAACPDLLEVQRVG